MSSVSRMGKLSSVLASTLALFAVVTFLQSTNLRETASAQDEPKAATKPSESDESSADKKDEPAHALSRFMRQKLQSSSSILEGLCTEDMSMVSEAAKKLKGMSGEEKWRVSNDMVYKRFSVEFVNAVDELQRQADDDDIDGASLAWFNVTMKCLKCHEWVRNTVVADLEK